VGCGFHLFGLRCLVITWHLCKNVTDIRVFETAGRFLTSWEAVSFSRTVRHGISLVVKFKNKKVCSLRRCLYISVLKLISRLENHEALKAVWGTFGARFQNLQEAARSCLSARFQQLGSYWTNFRGIWCFENFFENLSKKIKVSLKSDKNNKYFTRKPVYLYDDTSLNSS
jgi:hypothetical protein